MLLQYFLWANCVSFSSLLSVQQIGAKVFFIASFTVDLTCLEEVAFSAQEAANFAKSVFCRFFSIPLAGSLLLNDFSYCANNFSTQFEFLTDFFLVLGFHEYKVLTK